MDYKIPHILDFKLWFSMPNLAPSSVWCKDVAELNLPCDVNHCNLNLIHWQFFLVWIWDLSSFPIKNSCGAWFKGRIIYINENIFTFLWIVFSVIAKNVGALQLIFSNCYLLMGDNLSSNSLWTMP